MHREKEKLLFNYLTRPYFHIRFFNLKIYSHI